MMGACQRYTVANWKSSQNPKLKQSEYQNKVVLNYKPKYKINTYKSILIKTNDKNK